MGFTSPLKHFFESLVRAQTAQYIFWNGLARVIRFPPLIQIWESKLRHCTGNEKTANKSGARTQNTGCEQANTPNRPAERLKLRCGVVEKVGNRYESVDEGWAFFSYLPQEECEVRVVSICVLSVLLTKVLLKMWRTVSSTTS